MTLTEMGQRLLELRAIKDALEAQTKENNAAIEAMKEQISQQMIDDDCPKISTGGYSFSLQEKTIYSKRSEADMAQAGVDFFDTLREEGLGDIIKETVTTQTLGSTMRAYVEEHGALSEALGKVINTYETFDIYRRKDTKKGGKT